MTNQVAQTILAQLGGNKFCAMTGAKNFVADTHNLAFKLPGGKDGIRHVTVILQTDDLYAMVFRGRTGKLKGIHEGIFADMLQLIFTEATGLDTYL